MREEEQKVGGLANWLLERMHRAARPRPRLTMLERITLAPRQTLALVEADGRKFLVASSADGSPSFYPLEGARPRRSSGRISW